MGLPICLVDEVITCLGGLYISLSSQHVVQTISVMRAIWLVNSRFIFLYTSGQLVRALISALLIKIVGKNIDPFIFNYSLNCFWF